MKKEIAKVITIFFVCILCVVLGWFAKTSFIQNSSKTTVAIRENSPDYKYINPLILSEGGQESDKYRSLKKQINNYINSEKNKGDTTSVSVYFRDLNSGQWTGVNKDALYDPSSTLKVAVMMGYLNSAIDDPNIILKKFPYTGINNSGQNYKPVNPLSKGTYTAWDLIKAMIIDSDNEALNILYDNDRDDFIDVLKTLQMPPPASTTTIDFMSPETYSHLFRSLYNGTYLSKKISERALLLLTLTTFKLGLVAGVPEGTTIAHKFGEHTGIDSFSGSVLYRELHDCGIIYYPNNPYFLCVMTKGQNFPKLETVISGISNITYKEVDKENKRIH